MNTGILNSKSKLECLVLGHYDLGFDFHEGIQPSLNLHGEAWEVRWPRFYS